MWGGKGGDALPTPYPSPPVVVGRAGPEVTRVGKLSLPLTGGKVDPASSLGSTIELILVEREWVNQLLQHERRSSTWESGPHTLTGHNGTGSGDMRA